MFKEKFIKDSAAVRDTDWSVMQMLVSEIEKPGLSSDERAYLAGKIRGQQLSQRLWEEKNEVNAIDCGRASGIIVGGLCFAGGCILGVLVRVIRHVF